MTSSPYFAFAFNNPTALFVLLSFQAFATAQESPTHQQAQSQKSSHYPNIVINGSSFGWQSLSLNDFENVNCQNDTWSQQENTIDCTGNCVGVAKSKKQYTNFEMLLEWRHLKNGGNSGLFIWAPKESLTKLKPKTNGLPSGIEIQILDLGYKRQYEQNSGKLADWFTCHGDVFPVGNSQMVPFSPAAPNGRRSFPSGYHTKGVGEWNHYYIRAINGEVRLWVNGFEVSGGNQCTPSSGYLALESEGAPIEFRNLKIRELK